jgi:signal transduction histidine kinase
MVLKRSYEPDPEIKWISAGYTVIIATKIEQVDFSAKDTGLGIPEQVKPELFTLMMTTKSKGQGLGLAVVKKGW